MNVSLFLLLCCPDARSTCASERSIDSQSNYNAVFSCSSSDLIFPYMGTEDRILRETNG